jgi:hypothetical protein
MRTPRTHTLMDSVMDDIELDESPVDRASAHSHAVSLLRRSHVAPSHRPRTETTMQREDT